MAISQIDRWDKNRMNRFVAFITRSLVKPGVIGNGVISLPPGMGYCVSSGMESIACLN